MAVGNYVISQRIILGWGCCCLRPSPGAGGMQETLLTFPSPQAIIEVPASQPLSSSWPAAFHGPQRRLLLWDSQFLLQVGQNKSRGLAKRKSVYGMASSSKWHLRAHTKLWRAWQTGFGDLSPKQHPEHVLGRPQHSWDPTSGYTLHHLASCEGQWPILWSPYLHCTSLVLFCHSHGHSLAPTTSSPSSSVPVAPMKLS